MKRYGIGFLIFIMVSICVNILVYAYQFSYHQRISDSEQQQEQSVQTEGIAQKQDGYVIGERDGYVIVYMGDSETVYEYTTIEVEFLPLSIQNKVKSGLKVESLNEVYGFLENYSS